MLKIVICDDDEKFAMDLKQYFSDFAIKNMVLVEIKIYTDSEELLLAISKGRICDLLFLDIELGDTTGVEVGESIRKDIKNEAMQIVFVSAKENYAMQLFKVRPMNFLVKPVDYSQVEHIMQEYGRLYGYQTSFFEYQVGKERRGVDQNTILYFQSDGKKIRMVTQQGENEFYGKMSDVLFKLNGYSFCAVHKSYVINLRYVEAYGKDSIRMVNKDIIPVSRAMKDNLYEKLAKIGGVTQEYADNERHL